MLKSESGCICALLSIITNSRFISSFWTRMVADKAQFNFCSWMGHFSRNKLKHTFYWQKYSLQTKRMYDSTRGGEKIWIHNNDWSISNIYGTPLSSLHTWVCKKKYQIHSRGLSVFLLSIHLSHHSLGPQKSLENSGVSLSLYLFSETHKRPRTRRSEDALDRNLKSKAFKKKSLIYITIKWPLPGTAHHDKEVNACFFFHNS